MVLVPPMSWSFVVAVIREKQETLGEDNTVEIRADARR